MEAASIDWKLVIGLEGLIRYHRVGIRPFSMLKLLVGVLLSWPLLAQTVITGTFKHPDGQVFEGRVVISYTRATARLVCDTGRLISFRPVTMSIVNGQLGLAGTGLTWAAIVTTWGTETGTWSSGTGTSVTLTLIPTGCLSPALPYRAMVYDRMGTLVYTGRWTVPQADAADVSTLEVH